MFSGSLLFFFSALGVFNGFLLAVYFLLKSKQSAQHLLLGSLLLMLSVRVGKSVFYFFNPDLAQIYLQIGMSACFLIGPLVYLYTVSAVSNLENLKIDWRLHLGSLTIGIVIFGIAVPFSSYPDIWQNAHKIIYHLWLVYLLFAGWELKKAYWNNKNVRKGWKDPAFFTLSIYWGNVVIWFSFYTFKITSYIAGALTFSFILYLIILLAMIALSSKKSEDQDENNVKYKNKQLEDDEVEQLSHKLFGLMANHAIFTNANVTMPEVAKSLGVTPQKLSQLLNDNLNKSFPVFINEYRINYAKALLNSDRNITMDVLSEMAGFNSTSTFYSAFKKVTNTTPAEYRKANSS